MHGSLRRGLGAGVLAVAALFVSPVSLAQSANWTGTWGAPGCSRDDITIKLDRIELDLSTFETNCLVRRVRERGGLVELEASCSSEGEQKRASFKLKVDGSTLTFVEQRGFPFTPKRFQRCAAGDASRDTPAASSTPVASTKSELPLRRGYYVSDGTPCSQASNGTLNLLRRNAMGAARELCEFARIEQVGPARYRVRENCGEGGSQTVVYEIHSGSSFQRIDAHGNRYAARFCEQRELPSPWRTNKISDLIR